MGTIGLISVFLGQALIMLAAFYCFDRLVILEYRKFRKNWEKDGRPRGFMWAQRKAHYYDDFLIDIREDAAHLKIRFDWLFMTPNWIGSDIKARLLLYGWRILFVLAVLFPVLVFVIIGYIY